MNLIDLFAGIGGSSTGAMMAGGNVLWAANHWREAVAWHETNHPLVSHACQDLQQANWEEVPAHDVMLASPCCQGHSRARGKNKPEHDASRSTAWAPVSAAEYHRPYACVIENVPEFIEWELYGPWLQCWEKMGYSVSPHIIDAADHGVPQHRIRLFLVITKSKAPLVLDLSQRQWTPMSEVIDMDAGKWSPIRKPGRSKKTLARIFRGRRDLNQGRFLIPYYGSGSGLTGRDINRPIGTLTTRDRWAVVKGGQMRMLTKEEVKLGMGFPKETLLPDNHKLAVHLLGNAVCPPVMRDIVSALKMAA